MSLFKLKLQQLQENIFNTAAVILITCPYVVLQVIIVAVSSVVL